MRSIKHFFEQSWLLIVASFFFGLLIAVTNAALSARIAWNATAKLNALASGLLPEAEAFAPAKEALDIAALGGKPQTLPLYKATKGDETVGWIFTAVGSGFADKIELVVAVDARFEKLAGFDVLASNETPGFGDQIKYDYFRNQFKGAPAGTLTLASGGDSETIDAEIVTISGATVSSTAVVEAMSHYLVQVKEQMQQKGLIEP
jgi:H+/Na+-translocating ferredoxin:NAD+ oxidoreductase subunit G